MFLTDYWNKPTCSSIYFFSTLLSFFSYNTKKICEWVPNNLSRRTPSELLKGTHERSGWSNFYNIIKYNSVYLPEFNPAVANFTWADFMALHRQVFLLARTFDWPRNKSREQLAEFSAGIPCQFRNQIWTCPTFDPARSNERAAS